MSAKERHRLRVVQAVHERRLTQAAAARGLALVLAAQVLRAGRALQGQLMTAAALWQDRSESVCSQ